MLVFVEYHVEELCNPNIHKSFLEVLQEAATHRSIFEHGAPEVSITRVEEFGLIAEITCNGSDNLHLDASVPELLLTWQFLFDDERRIMEGPYPQKRFVHGC